MEHLKKKERRGKTENKVLKILRDKLEIKDVTEERAHIVKPYQNKKNNKGKASPPRAIVCKLLNYKDKTQILRKCNRLKGTSNYINEDFSTETLALGKNLWKEVKTLREEGKIAYLHYSNIIWRDKNEI